MEDNKKKCSFKEHKEIDAIYYCYDCKVYICNKCYNSHQSFLENHSILNLDNNKEIFIDICKEKNHPNKLEFYCKNHNQLCCVACFSKIETRGYGQHKNCDICDIKDIKEEKKNKLKENIKYIEDLSKNLDNSIHELKLLFDKIDEQKDKLKSEIQNIFTKIRTALNEREDELLLEVNKKFDEKFGNEDIIKEGEKLPNKIKLSLEKGKLIDNEWNDNNKLSSIINSCINIEDNIKNINIINDNIKKCKNNNDSNIECNIQPEYFNNLINSIKSLGKISDKYDINSSILKNKDDINKFYNLLSNKIKINNIKLLYRANRDGLKLDNLYKKINNKSNLIFLFLSGNIRIFGVFIMAKINFKVENDTYIKDKDAFVFSLNNNKIYEVLITDYAIRFHKNCPILVGNNNLSNGFWLNSGKFNEGSLANPKIYNFQKNDELTENYKDLTDFEVFEINY